MNKRELERAATKLKLAAQHSDTLGVKLAKAQNEVEELRAELQIAKAAKMKALEAVLRLLKEID